MLTTTPFFRPVAGTVPLPMIVERAVGADLSDQGTDLGRPDIDADQDRLSFHADVVPFTGSAAG